MAAVTSNSVFFTVRPTPPLEGSGFRVLIRDLRYGRAGTVVGVVSEFVQLSFGPELSAPGAGTLALDEAAPFWNTTLSTGESAQVIKGGGQFVFDVVEDGLSRFWFLGETVSNQIVGPDETQSVVFGGPGIADVLRWAVILRPGWPRDVPAELTTNPDTIYTGTVDNPYNVATTNLSTSSSNDVPAQVWKFPTEWPTMRMWYTLLGAAQSRHVIPFVTPLFTATTDSGGEEWEYVPTVLTASGNGFQPNRGIDLLTFLNTCTGQDTGEYFAMRAEWVMHPGFGLEIRKTIGSHREKQVAFFDGGIVSNDIMHTRKELANYVIVEDVYAYTSLAMDEDSMNRWGIREQLQNKNANVTDTARRNALSWVYLEQSHDDKIQWTVQVPYDEHGRRPFDDFTVGDWIGIAHEVDDGGGVTGSVTGAGSTVVDPFRVMAITVQVDSDGQPEVELTLNSKLDTRERELEIELTRIQNAVNDPLFGALPGYPTDTSAITVDPNGNLGYTDLTDLTSVSDGTGDGIRMFIQNTDPGDQARVGDLWYDTSVNETPTYTYDPDDDEVLAGTVPSTFIGPVPAGGQQRQRVPGTTLIFE